MLFIIDNYYPYAGGETFLKEELEVLGELEIPVTIIPISIRDESINKNTIPQNIHCSIIKPVSLFTKCFCLLSSLFDNQLYSDFLSIIKDGFNLRKCVAAIYYCYKTNLLFHQIWPIISKCEDNKKVIYSYWMHIHACVASKIKKKDPSIKFVTRAHGYDLYTFRSKSNYLPGRKIIFDHANFIFPVSSAGKDYLESKYSFLDTSKVVTSYLGTFDSGLNPMDKRVLRIVSCSNMVPVKRINLLIDALALINNVEIEWIHFGDGSLFDDLKKNAEEKLKSNIKFTFSGHLPKDQIMDYYKKYHITYFINTSESEGLPVSIMEAMSFGIPVIATNVGGTNEIVVDSYNGFLLDPDISSYQLSKVIQSKIKLEDSYYCQLRHNARSYWEEHFNGETNYKDFYNLINIPPQQYI